jgi:hypothetical protein
MIILSDSACVILKLLFPLAMAAARSSETLVPAYRITRHHIPKDNKFLEKIR